MQKQLATGIALAFVCLPAMAEPQAGFYSGVSAGKVTLEDTVYGLHIEESGSGFSVFAGYRFNQYGSLELTYLDGSGDDRAGGWTIETDANAVQGSLLWQQPIGARFEGFVRIGFAMWDAEHSARNGTSTLTLDTDGTDWVLGAGAALHVTPKFSLRAEYGGAELEGTDVRLLSLAGLYRF